MGDIEATLPTWIRQGYPRGSGRTHARIRRWDQEVTHVDWDQEVTQAFDEVSNPDEADVASDVDELKQKILDMAQRGENGTGHIPFFVDMISTDCGRHPYQAWIPATTSVSRDPKRGVDSWGFGVLWGTLEYSERQHEKHERQHGFVESKPKVKFGSYKYRTVAGNFWTESGVPQKYNCAICLGEKPQNPQIPRTKLTWVDHMWRDHCLNLYRRYQCKFCNTFYAKLDRWNKHKKSEDHVKAREGMGRHG